MIANMAHNAHTATHTILGDSNRLGNGQYRFLLPRFNLPIPIIPKCNSYLVDLCHMGYQEPFGQQLAVIGENTADD